MRLRILKSKEIIEKSKEDANSEAENMLLEAETSAKKEALHISNKTADEVEKTKKLAMDKVEEASAVVVANIL